MISRVSRAAAGLSIALAAAAPLAAQNTLDVGIKGGISFGDVSNKGILPGNLEGRTGFVGGFSFGLGKVVGVGAELLYAQRGVKSSSTAATLGTRLDYIDIPVYLKLSTATKGVGVFGLIGPQFSKEVHCSQGNVGDCISNTNRSKTDFSGVVGAGLRFGGSLGLSLEGRYLYGLKDLKLNTITSSNSYKTRTFLLLAGIAI